MMLIGLWAAAMVAGSAAAITWYLFILILIRVAEVHNGSVGYPLLMGAFLVVEWLGVGLIMRSPRTLGSRLAVLSGLLIAAAVVNVGVLVGGAGGMVA